jgi:hypothetical protein
VKGHGQQPRSWAIVLLRGCLALLVLLGILWATQWRQRISAPALERDVAGKLQATPARCSDQSGNGSRWACLVGPPPQPRCVVVTVSITGRWSLVRRPRHCRYP